MIHIDIENDILEIDGEDMSELAAEATILLEIMGCSYMLERGNKGAAGFLLGEITKESLRRLEDPKDYVWELSKNLVIRMIRRARDGKKVC